MTAKQYCLPLFELASTTGGLTDNKTRPKMAKPKKKQGPTLFDDIQDEPLDAPAPPLTFTERVGEKASATSFAELVRPTPPVEEPKPITPLPDPIPESVRGPPTTSGEKGKARDILAAIRTLHQVEARGTPATPEERDALSRFCGFGPVALSIFPNPGSGEFKPGWQELGEELKALLTPDEYASVKRTTFSQFFTSPTVMASMHSALTRLGVPDNAKVLEPGCGIGNFIRPGYKFIGVEQDSISGRVAKALHPEQDIRIEDFQQTRLPELDAVIGNVPFADVKLEYRGQRLALHDFFLAKSVDSLKPGGVLALVTSHYTLDKQNAAIREYLSDKADFIGAIRLPSDAFRREGTAVVTDIVFLRKRAPGEPENHADYEWKQSAPFEIDGSFLPINRYFHNHPEMVLGTYSGKDSLYGEGYSVLSNGDLAEQMKQAVGRLPQCEPEKPQVTAPTHQVEARALQVAPTFVPPPPERHVTEGSFFVHDGRIHQLVDGQSAPVVYGGGELWANGALVGRRMGALIELRDLARRVLQSQNEGWPEDARTDARRKLNHAYDRFRSAYGPINKTTISETKDETSIRRMPNLVKFREDPDAMLVMALEEYDEATGEAKKAAIMLRDVVGKAPPVTSVATAEEGLLVSLDRKGAVDLPYIAQLYGKPEDKVVTELGDLIYHDPESKRWETADAYLSGNVRAKLAAAEKARIARNIDALKAVQPEDVLPGDIDANLGAPWIPVADVQAFAADLFRVEPDAITIAHMAKDAVWSVEGDYSAERSVAVTSDYGTSRASGLWLLDLALNLRSPIIYDPVPGDPDKRMVNQEETLKAKEKQKAIKEQFRGWIFGDPDRTERLVRDYNDKYNNLQPRVFDGSHLDFPGMSDGITLRQHQKDAIWRCMSGGNTLLAHTVGAGKTYAMAASAMKMKQAGLIKKPLIAIPNHMLEQFGREFLQLYPNAKLLIASKEDFTKDRRKFLTAKIASGDWDAIIVTHSSFERLGMSSEYQERFLREQIAEYDELLADRAKESYSKSKRNLTKVIEKQKAAREAKLKDLLAEDKKDGGLVFDELGVDQLFIDELQFYKNLDVVTKMDRVAGIQTGGSERAFDLFMKARYLHDQHPGHGLVGASGTPISNSLVELYTLQRFFDPQGLRDRGIEHFDAWAATFGEVVEAMEISPDGKSLKPRARFSKFVNLPELQQMFRSFSDVQTAEMLNLPRPKLEGGKPHIVACPMSDEQEALQQKLVERYERIRNGGVDPREDNALAITTDGRKLALDARMLSREAAPASGSKVEAMLDRTVDTWKRTADRKATQMIFCDMGVNPTTWGYGVYDEIVSGLIRRGIPRDQIAVMGDADSDAKKQALFEKVRNGVVRVLIGSTSKMGTGTNVQKRLVAMHHLDAPWKPAEVEQRDGRILRQGNQNEEVAIYRYVTTGSFDSYMWQALETKARFIGQIMTGESGLRRAEDVGGQELSYAEVKAIASGNPAVLTLAEADAELQRLGVLRRNHADEQYIARIKLRELPQSIERMETRLAALEADTKTLDGGDSGVVIVGGRSVTPQEPAFANALNRLPLEVSYRRQFPLGQYRGLRFGIELHPGGAADVYLEGQAVRSGMLNSLGSRAVMNGLGRVVDSYAEVIERVKQERELARRQLVDYEARIGRVFTHTAYMEELTGLRDRLKVSLSGTPAEGEPTAAELAGQIKALTASHQVEAAPARLRPTPRADAVRRRVEQPKLERVESEAKPEEPKPDATEVPKPVDEDDDTPASQGPAASFTARVKRFQQRSLF